MPATARGMSLREAWPTWRELVDALRPGSGPAVARAFHAALGVLFCIAFVSLAVQVEVLIGREGLSPARPLVASVMARDGVSFTQFPTVFSWIPPTDAWLVGVAWFGAALGLAAALGLWPRALIAVASLLYLSYVTIAGDFLAFQWDNLLVECGVLAVFLPRRAPGRLLHVLCLLLLFKLYFESGLAKWQSHLHDWHDGSAMTHYYETAPIPAGLAWLSHHLPAAWHHAESRLALELELIVPFFVFGPRVLRLCALVALTGFQLINIATANYGFFCYLALALHLFLLDDRDLERAGAWLRVRVLRRAPRRPAQVRAELSASSMWRQTLAFYAAWAMVAAWVPLSLAKGLRQFTRGKPSDPIAYAAWQDAWKTWPRPIGAWLGQPEIDALDAVFGAARVVNNYHLFGHITRERPEPEFQVQEDGVPSGGAWRALHLHYKPGPLDRRPPYVAPHQPRVDFRLWFYGLGRGGGAPAWIRTLVDRLCYAPHAVASLFATPLPIAPRAVRIAFWHYRFTQPDAYARSGDYWTRTAIGATAPRECSPAGEGPK